MSQSHTRIKADKLIKICNKNIKKILKHRDNANKENIKNYMETINNKRLWLNKFGLRFKPIDQNTAIKELSQDVFSDYPDMSYSKALIVAYKIKTLAKESSEKSGMITITSEDCLLLFPF